jgi:hypothetical protein
MCTEELKRKPMDICRQFCDVNVEATNSYAKLSPGMKGPENKGQSLDLYLHPMALRSLKNLDLPQERSPFVSSPSLPSPATNSHRSEIFLHVVKLSNFGPANTPSSFRFAHIQFSDDPFI